MRQSIFLPCSVFAVCDATEPNEGGEERGKESQGTAVRRKKQLIQQVKSQIKLCRGNKSSRGIAHVPNISKGDTGVAEG